MPLSEVRAGMKGTGLTVVHGTRVEPFNVDILGVVPNAGPAGDLILVRVGGPLMDETGGIAAGMSGSPVYVDGRLVGAVSYGFSFSDHRVGFLTPSEQMLPLVEEARRLDERSAKTGAEEKPLPEVISVGGAEVAVPDPTPLATPLMVSGLNDRVFRRLQELVAPLGYRAELGGRGPQAAAGSGQADPGAADTAAGEERLVPGSAFGAALVTGDVSVTAIGTVTYTEGDYFAGFGHPFLNKGPVALPAGLAEIYQTVQSQEAPFKLGGPRKWLGTLLVDRPTGVAGRSSGLPAGIDVRVEVEDLDRQARTAFHATVAPDETLAPDLVALAALQAMDRGLARLGRGTAEVSLVLKGEGLPGGQLSRENTFYSGADIGAAALRDLAEGVALVTGNPFKPVGLRQVELKARVGGERRTGVIEKAQLVGDGRVKPGEAVELEVLIRPYRGEVRRERLRLAVPADFPAGRYTVVVRGGPAAPVDEGQGEEAAPSDEGGHPPNPEKLKQAPGKAQEPKTGAESFEELLDQFVQRERNNELVAELSEPSAGEGEGQTAPAQTGGETPKPAWHPPVRRSGPGQEAAQAPPEGDLPRAKVALPYVVLGSAAVEIEIGDGGLAEPPVKNPPAPRWERPRREP